jgi:glycosyltransferase involved in cell wall biosynthesis
LKTIQIDKNKTSVAYNALNYPYLPMPKNQALELINERLPELQEPFFFHLGGNQWYKNRKGVAEIFSHIAQFSGYQKHLLILAGKQWPQDLQEKIKTLGIEDRVIAISDLSNEEVRAFYSTCEAMIFPSLEEGFGWPIAEAQACGAIVVTTNRAPMTEVGGNAAINIEPENPKASAEVIVESLSKENDLKKLGIENAKRFSTEEMIQSYLDGYQIAVNLKRVG